MRHHLEVRSSGSVEDRVLSMGRAGAGVFWYEIVAEVTVPIQTGTAVPLLAS